MTLIALALAFSLTNDVPPPTPRPPALPLLETGMMNESGYVALLTIAPDGRWTGTAEQSGTLTPDELAKLKGAVESVVIDTTPGPECTRTPVLHVLRVARGESRYADTCGPQAHPSVRTLIDLAATYTTRRANPMVVRLDRWRPTKKARKESTILMRSGVWTTDNGAGNTGGPELADAIALFDAVVLEPPTKVRGPDCQVEFVHEIQIPGRGQLSWSSPCDAPGPSLKAALDKLFAIVGQPR